MLTMENTVAIKSSLGRDVSLNTPAGVLRGLAWSNPGAPRVLALHGWLDNAASFIPLAPYLAGFDLIALDLPGHGHSDHIASGHAYHLSHYAAEVLRALDALQWDACFLLGHSLGGAVGTLVTATAPHRILALSLIDQIGPLSEPAADFPDRLKRSIEAHAVSQDQKKAEYPTLDELVERRRLVGGIDDEGARLLVTRNSQRGANGYYWRSDPRLRLPAPLYLDEGQAQAILTSIQCPVQMILASDGLVAARPNTERRIEIMANLVVEKMTGGHHLHMDNPGPVADVLVSFLQSHVPADD